MGFWTYLPPKQCFGVGIGTEIR